jgi:hypothetical protein
LEEKVEQLKDGLANSQNNLGSALQECTSNAACASFLQEFNLQSDLALGMIILYVINSGRDSVRYLVGYRYPGSLVPL